MPGSSVAEQVTVNHLVAGSIPARAAINNSMDKTLVCFWGKLKTGTFLKNNPFTENEYYEERNVNFKTLIDNLKEEFKDHELNFLLSTWSNVNTSEFETDIKYLLKHEEPLDWESYLNSINFPHVSQIRGHPVYHVGRPGYYTRMFNMLEIAKFLEKNKLVYDNIVFSRTDIYFKFKDFKSLDFKKDVCFIPETYWGSRGTGVNDHIIMGNFNYILNAIKIDSIESMHDLFYHSWNPEEAFGRTLIKNNSNYENFVCDKYCRFPIAMK